MTVRYKTARSVSVTVKWRDAQGVMHSEHRPMNAFEWGSYMLNWARDISLPKVYGV